ncbi:MAG: carbon starvation protein A [Phycisphaerae bacterium]
MEVLLLLLVCSAGYVIAYNTYGRFLAKKIFKLKQDAKVPSVEFKDGIDYVPSRRGIIFGHHYTSIAGTGPIVGPAIGVIWGWLPALLWVTLGCIFMGAVHDFGTLVISLRNEGKSISEVAAKYINRRVRFILFIIVFLTLLIVIAVFGMVIAVIFAQFPTSLIPVWFQIPIAMMLGYAIYKKGANLFFATAIAVITMYLSIWLGSLTSFQMPSIGPIPPTGVWTIILLAYGWIASTLPVTMLLQPRDYINAWQLFVAMTLLFVGVIFAAFSGSLQMAAPAINTNVPADAPSLWPFLFVIIACGAVSGFHSLVASGTSPKQIAKEPDALMIGYGSMLLEGLLAVLVLICVGAGIGIAYTAADGSILTGQMAWLSHYRSFSGAEGLGANLSAFVTGAANLIGTMKIPTVIAATVMGVFVASFAGTTLDTAVRIQRYVIGEIAFDLKIKSLTNRWTATTLAVLTAAGLAFATGADGRGALKLWPMFGIANQLLAALALLLVTIYLKTKGGLKYILAGIPALIMLAVTISALIIKEKDYIRNFGDNWLLASVAAALFVLAAWMTIETILVFFTAKQRANSD